MPTSLTADISKASLSVTANDATKTYNGQAFSGGNGLSYSGFVNGETSTVLGGTLTYAGTAQGAVNAGTYSLTVSGLSSGNYDIAYLPGILTISPAASIAVVPQTQPATSLLDNIPLPAWTNPVWLQTGMQGDDGPDRQSLLFQIEDKRLSMICIAGVPGACAGGRN